MAVKTAEARLLQVTGKVTASETEQKVVLKAAFDYGKAKIMALHSRDRWKAKKRLGQRT